MCTSDDPMAEEPECKAGSGWIVFVDTNENCARDDGEEVVTNVRIDSDVNAATNGDCISFASTGFRRVVGGQPTTQRMLYCDSRKNTERSSGSDNSAARGVEVMATGRGAVITSVAQIDEWADGDAGVECP
jgi:Tfp pilus assembly protein FimT